MGIKELLLSCVNNVDIIVKLKCSIYAYSCEDTVNTIVAKDRLEGNKQLACW